MLLRAYRMPASTNEVFVATGAGQDEYITLPQMIQAAQQFGLTLEYHDGRGLEDLRGWLDERRPFIALVNYDVWSSRGLTQDDFSGSHFVVVVGYDEGNVFVNDPDYQLDRRLEGDHKSYTTQLFDQAWHDLLVHDNPNGAVLVPDRAMPVQPGDPRRGRPRPRPWGAFWRRIWRG
jgi:ABC-type bacteriocin/lantibiotic exporter with double-glycine peptidase domain